MTSTGRRASSRRSCGPRRLLFSAVRTRARRGVGRRRREGPGLSSEPVAPLNILVTGACGVTPRAIARSLRASASFSDATLVGADRGGNWYGCYEGLYDRVYRVSQPSDPGYADLVSEICEREEIDVALVAPEAEVLFWSGREFPVP